MLGFVGSRRIMAAALAAWHGLCSDAGKSWARHRPDRSSINARVPNRVQLSGLSDVSFLNQDPAHRRA